MYLDPGFGSMLIQGIVAALAAGGAYLILMRKKIAAFFQNRKAVKNAEENQQNDAETEK
jgi:hypothetical protein